MHTTQLAGQWMERGHDPIYGISPNPDEQVKRRLFSPQRGALMTISSSGIEGQTREDKQEVCLIWTVFVGTTWSWKIPSKKTQPPLILKMYGCYFWREKSNKRKDQCPASGREISNHLYSEPGTKRLNGLHAIPGLVGPPLFVGITPYWSWFWCIAAQTGAGVLWSICHSSAVVAVLHSFS